MRWLSCLLVVLATLPLPAQAQKESPKTPVYVIETSPDPVGTRLVYALREQLRASHGLALVSNESDSFLQVNLVTIDPGNKGRETVYSAVITVRQLGRPTARLYWNNFVGVCGASRVKECANGLIAYIDKSSTDIRALLYESAHEPPGNKR